MAQTFGDKWIVERDLNEGGQAHTFLVKNSANEYGVLKRLKNLKRLERFTKEIKACLELSHPNILTILDEDLHAARPFFVSEYCENGELTQESISGLSLIEKLELFSLVCKGVGHAHSKNIVHRDLKPDNIFLRGDNTPVVGDFGLCFITDEGERVTVTEEQVGSRFYMAPELAHGRAEDVTTAADVYSLGKILYWIVAGKIFDREVHRQPRFNLTINQTDTPYFFVYELLDRTIVEDPSKRIQHASELETATCQIVDLVKEHAHVLDLKVPQKCIYCGVGHYRVIANSTSRNDRSGSIDVNNFGFKLVASPLWLIMVCNHCSNVQIFRPDYVDNETDWKGL